MTPFETGDDGLPLKWGSSIPEQPTQISLAIARYNYVADQGSAPNFTGSLPDSFVPLLTAAAHVWEAEANIRFVIVPDATSDASNIPDIRVGLADLAKGIGNPPTSFLGLTVTQWDPVHDSFVPDVLISIEDPMETPVTQLPGGDFQYQGKLTTVFQDLLHELGHSIGLDHNLSDPTSIMSPTLGMQNRLPDSQDIAAIQSLYGPAPMPLNLSSGDAATLHALAPSLSV